MAFNAWNYPVPVYQTLFTISDSDAESPGTRCGHTLTPVFVNNSCRLILFGGSLVSEIGAMAEAVTNSVHSFDITTRKWTRLNPRGEAPSPRAAHAAAQFGGLIAIQGGIGQSGICNGDLYLLDLRCNNLMWYRVAGHGMINPGPRYGHVMDFVANRLILFGGRSGKELLADTWALDITKKPFAWERLNTLGNVPSERMYAAASGRDDGVFLICGGRDCNEKALRDTIGLRLDEFGQWVWSAFPDIASSQRYQHAAVFVGPRFHVIGGVSKKHQLVDGEGAVTALNTHTGQWLGRSLLGISTSNDQYQTQLMQRCRHAVASIGGYIYVHGGLRNGALLGDFLVAQDSFCSQASSSSQPPVPSFWGSSSSGSSYASSSTGQTDNEARIDGGYAEHQRRTVPIPRESFGNWGGLVRQRSLERSRNENNQPNRMDDSHIPQVLETVNNVLNEIESPEDLRKRIISTLLRPRGWKPPATRDFFLTYEEIEELCNAVEQIFMQEPTVLQLKIPIKVFGDIHGQFRDLMRLFREYGSPSIAGEIKCIDFLFLGDYVDRGQHSLETIILLFALKVEYPDNFHLIRGNHECEEVNINYGFYSECLERMGQFLGVETYKRINRVFNYLPLAALIEKKIFCMHGGIGNSVHTVEQVTSIQRPISWVDTNDVVRDLLWSDPTDGDNILGIVESGRGATIFAFGPDIVRKFCERNKIELIIRAHECVRDGFERFAGGKLITVFSATNYCGTAENAGAILVIGRDWVIVPKLIHPCPPSLESSEDSSPPEERWLMKLNDEQPPTPPRRGARPGIEEMQGFTFTNMEKGSSSSSGNDMIDDQDMDSEFAFGKMEEGSTENRDVAVDIDEDMEEEFTFPILHK